MCGRKCTVHLFSVALNLIQRSLSVSPNLQLWRLSRAASPSLPSWYDISASVLSVYSPSLFLSSLRSEQRRGGNPKRAPKARMEEGRSVENRKYHCGSGVPLSFSVENDCSDFLNLNRGSFWYQPLSSKKRGRPSDLVSVPCGAVRGGRTDRRTDGGPTHGGSEWQIWCSNSGTWLDCRFVF